MLPVPCLLRFVTSDINYFMNYRVKKVNHFTVAIFKKLIYMPRINSRVNNMYICIKGTIAREVFGVCQIYNSHE